MGETIHILERLLSLNDLRDMLAVAEALDLALPEVTLLSCVDWEDIAAPCVGLGLVQYAHVDGYAHPEEEVLGQAEGDDHASPGPRFFDCSGTEATISYLYTSSAS